MSGHGIDDNLLICLKKCYEMVLDNKAKARLSTLKSKKICGKESEPENKKVEVIMPQNWFPRYYSAFKYLGLPAGKAASLKVLLVTTRSGPKRKAKVMETSDDATKRVLATGPQNVRLEANCRLCKSDSINTPSLLNIWDAKSKLDRIENEKYLIAQQTPTALMAWEMNTNRLEALLKVDKDDKDNRDTDDDTETLK